MIMHCTTTMIYKDENQIYQVFVHLAEINKKCL